MWCVSVTRMLRTDAAARQQPLTRASRYLGGSRMLQFCRALAFILIWTQLMLSSPLLAYAQASGDTGNSGPTTAELHQLVAPIALYPDSLVGQILAASQYPTEIVEAQQWAQNNSGLSPTQLAQGANSQTWHPR